MNNRMNTINPYKAIIWSLVGLLLTVALCFGGCAGAKSFNRFQKRADAHNNAVAERLKVESVKARAEQRYQESIGIRKAQDEIAKTLTPLYVQHEAIQAQKESGDDRIYIPAGEQGIPLVNNVSGDRVRDEK